MISHPGPCKQQLAFDNSPVSRQIVRTRRELVQTHIRPVRTAVTLGQFSGRGRATPAPVATRSPGRPSLDVFEFRQVATQRLAQDGDVEVPREDRTQNTYNVLLLIKYYDVDKTSAIIEIQPIGEWLPKRPACIKSSLHGGSLGDPHATRYILKGHAT